MSEKLIECVIILIIIVFFFEGYGNIEVNLGKLEILNNYFLGVFVFSSMGVILYLMND